MTRIPGRGPITGISAWQAASPRARHLTHKGRDRSAQRPSAPRHREDPAVAAQRAGDCGRITPPVGYHRRLGSYHRQNGAPILTPKQRRRLEKKGYKHADLPGTPS